MRNREKVPKTKPHPDAPRWLRIAIPAVVIVAWVALTAFGGPYFAKISDVAESDLTAFLPSDSDSARVSDEAAKFRSSETVSSIVLFRQENSQVLTGSDKTSISQFMTKLEQVEGTAAAGDVVVSEDGKAAFAVLPIESNGEVDAIVEKVREVSRDNRIDHIDNWVTGPAGFLSDLSTAFGGIDGILLFVALGVVFVILLFVYRSPMLPVLVLLSALSALTVAVLIVWHLADAGIVKINGQVQGILFILVIGAATDYSLLFVSRLREELYAEKDKARAVIKAWKGVLEPILASGGTVIAGLLCMLASNLGANKALGPVGAIGIVMAMLAALTFLPAVLYAIGRVAFWPRTPRTDKATVAKHVRRLQKGLWHRIGDFVGRHPRPIWIITVIVLGMACIGVGQLKANGVPQDQVVLGYSEAREGQKVLDEHFPAGSGTSALILIPVEKQDQVVAVLDDDKGVDSVAAVATGVTAGAMPLGRSEQAIKDALKGEIQKKAAAMQIPNIDLLVEVSYPFKNAKITVSDGNILLSVTLTDGPYTSEAEATIQRIRSEMRAIDGQVLVGGTTAVSMDTNAAALEDRSVIIPMVLGVITIILMILLRAIIAPLLLLATTVLSFGAAMGVSALMFNHVWNFPGADSTVILYGFIFLVALGIDYNIFLMTRVREESKKLGTRIGVIRALVVTGGVITSAGIVLASTFAALAVIPILFLAQIAFTVAFGVLLDTIVVRSLLVPALIKDVGAIVWWPSKLRKKQ